MRLCFWFGWPGGETPPGSHALQAGDSVPYRERATRREHTDREKRVVRYRIRGPGQVVRIEAVTVGSERTDASRRERVRKRCDPTVPVPATNAHTASPTAERIPREPPATPGVTTADTASHTRSDGDASQNRASAAHMNVSLARSRSRSVPSPASRAAPRSATSSGDSAASSVSRRGPFE